MKFHVAGELLLTSAITQQVQLQENVCKCVKLLGTQSSPQKQSLKYLQTLTQMSHLMLTKLWTVFQFQQPIIYKLVQFLQLVCFLSCCSSHTVCFCHKWYIVVAMSDREPQHQSAVPCFSLSTHLVHHSELSSSDLHQPFTFAFSGLLFRD